jgi:hypothetical protein
MNVCYAHAVIYYVVKACYVGDGISPVLNPSNGYGTYDKQGKFALSFPSFPLLNIFKFIKLTGWIGRGNGDKMDILQLIYEVHDFISKYVQRAFGEGE